MKWALTAILVTSMTACADDVDEAQAPAQTTDSQDAGTPNDAESAGDTGTGDNQNDAAPGDDAAAPSGDVDEPSPGDVTEGEPDADDGGPQDVGAEDVDDAEDVEADDVTTTDVREDINEGDTTNDDVNEDEPDAEPPPPIYLASVDNNLNRLRLYDVESDTLVIACTFQDPVNYPSITFGLDGTLYGSRNGQFLDIIDPCDCTTTYVGDMGYDGIVGITANGVKEVELYGLSRTEDLLLTVDLEDGAGSPVGMGLGVDFGYSGSTWSSDIVGLYAIDSTTNTLYTIGTDSGLATNPILLDANFGTVGIEWHPFDSSLYACTDGAVYRVDPSTGETTFLTRFEGGCNNLAAPWIRIQCLEDRLTP